MGEARRRKELSAAATARLPELDSAKLAAAVRQVVGAMTDAHGADCLLFAAIGAGALQQLGVACSPVAGSAAWRVGPGDSDTISHAREIQGPLYAPSASSKAAIYHAWVEGPGLLADFSTCTLALKAAQLDAADGGSTRVDWAPELMWLVGARPAARLGAPSQVNASFETGVYCYVRHADIEAAVLPDIATLMQEMSAAIAAAVTAYHALCAGHVLRVAGIGEDSSIQTEPRMRELEAVSGRVRPDTG